MCPTSQIDRKLYHVRHCRRQNRQHVEEVYSPDIPIGPLVALLPETKFGGRCLDFRIDDHRKQRRNLPEKRNSNYLHLVDVNSLKLYWAIIEYITAIYWWPLCYACYFMWKTLSSRTAHFNHLKFLLWEQWGLCVTDQVCIHFIHLSTELRPLNNCLTL